MNNERFLVRGSILVLISTFIAQGVWFAVRWFIARFFGPADYGILQFTLSATSLLYLVFAFGAPVVIARSRTDDGEHLRLASSFFFVSTALFLVAIFALLFLAPWIAGKFDVPVAALYAATLAAYFFALLQISISASRAAHRVREKVLIDTLLTRLLLSSLALILAFLGISYLAVPLAYFVSALVSLFLLAKLFGFTLPRPSEMLAAIRSGMLYALSAFTIISLVNTDVIMLAWLIGPVAVGIYGVALLFVQILRNIAQSIAYPIYPSFSAAKSEESVNAIYSRGVLLTSLFFVPLGFLALLFPEAILSLFGSDYLPATSVLQIFGVFALLAPFFIHAPPLTAARRRDLVYFLSGLTAAILNVVLNYWLIRNMGILGAGVATVISLLVFYLINFVHAVLNGLSLRPPWTVFKIYILAFVLFFATWCVTQMLSISPLLVLFLAISTSLFWLILSLRIAGVSLRSIINRYLL